MSKDKYVVEQLLDATSLASRALKCRENGLCFISLKPFADEASKALVQHPTLGEVAVDSKYVG